MFPWNRQVLLEVSLSKRTCTALQLVLSEAVRVLCGAKMFQKAKAKALSVLLSSAEMVFFSSAVRTHR